MKEAMVVQGVEKINKIREPYSELKIYIFQFTAPNRADELIQATNALNAITKYKLKHMDDFFSADFDSLMIKKIS